MNWNELIADPVRQMLTRILDYLPILLGGLIILIVGWIVAKAIRRAVDWLLKAVRFDVMADKAGISEVLRKGDLKTNAREVVSGLVYWLIIIMVLVMTVDTGTAQGIGCSCKLIRVCPQGDSGPACSGGCDVPGQFRIGNSSHGLRQCETAQALK